ncbi:MAG: sodium-dependent transporter [Bifidobacteriaceae bacterium]|jgi:NSS family neurotransmitter:Na+ symporter|nr:sodium-dependent transporter [Bifidobacteriaceae bacterium]
MSVSIPPEAAPAQDRQQWSGQYGFIISAIGSAVGLGNIWRFPGVAYENGGGAFMIPYLVALVTAGIPILFLDYALGHRFRGSPPLAFRRIARWAESLGWFQVMICVFIGIYYAAILAWAASYFYFSFNRKWGDDTVGFLLGEYLKTDGATGGFQALVGGVVGPLAAIWVLAIIIMALGVKKGVERTNAIAIPALVVAFGILVVRALFLPGASEGINALFQPDFAALSKPTVWVAAYAQIFFSLSIAFGIMLTYSSYRKRRSNLTSPGLVVAFANSSFEIMAGLGVFSALAFMSHEAGVPFAEYYGPDGAGGTIKGVGLSFMTFPKVINEMPGGALFGALFFGSLLLAGFTSLLSILQVISGGLQDKFDWSPAKAALVLGVPMAIVSVIGFGTKAGLPNLDTVDKYTNEVGIVFSAVVMVVLVCWVLRRDKELAWHLSTLSTFKVGWIWRCLVGVVSPLALGYILVRTVIDLMQQPYSGYSWTLLNVAGWGSVIISIVAALAFCLVKWRRDPLDFTPYPALDVEEVK